MTKLKRNVVRKASVDYLARTDRNIGWITREEQEHLRNSVVGVAGVGGMGGLLAATLVRTGIGEVRIADTETFDLSNLNRQYGAITHTIGKPKAVETARMLRAITDDVRIRVFPDGITTRTATAFSDRCDIICDEIEFWAVGSRLVLHRAAISKGIPVITCTSVGFGSRLLYFDHTGMCMEDMLGIPAEEALLIEERIRNDTASMEEIERVLQASLNAIAPGLPRYTLSDSAYDDRAKCLERLRGEQRASIIGSNPPLASGFIADRVILALLAQAGHGRTAATIPTTPGYLQIDAAFMTAECIYRTEM